MRTMVRLLLLVCALFGSRERQSVSVDVGPFWYSKHNIAAGVSLGTHISSGDMIVTNELLQVTSHAIGAFLLIQLHGQACILLYASVHTAALGCGFMAYYGYEVGRGFQTTSRYSSPTPV